MCAYCNPIAWMKTWRAIGKRARALVWKKLIFMSDGWCMSLPGWNFENSHPELVGMFSRHILRNSQWLKLMPITVRLFPHLDHPSTRKWLIPTLKLNLVRACYAKLPCWIGNLGSAWTIGEASRSLSKVANSNRLVVGLAAQCFANERISTSSVCCNPFNCGLAQKSWHKESGIL